MKRICMTAVTLWFCLGFMISPVTAGEILECIDCEDGSYAIITSEFQGPTRATASNSKTYTYYIYFPNLRQGRECGLTAGRITLKMQKSAASIQKLHSFLDKFSPTVRLCDRAQTQVRVHVCFNTVQVRIFYKVKGRVRDF